MILAKDAIPSKFSWRTSPRIKRPPPSNRTSQIPAKKKRLEDLFGFNEHANVTQNLSLLEASCTSTLDSSSTSTAEDVVSNEPDTAELHESNESLKLQLLQGQKEIARLRVIKVENMPSYS